MRYFKQISKQLTQAMTVLLAALLAAACGSSSSGTLIVPQSLIRVVHAVADAPRVNVYLNDNLVLEDFDFRSGTGVLSIDAGTYDVRVEAIVPPPGSNIDVIDVAGVTFAEGTQTTVYATGTTAPLAIAPLLVSDPTSAVAAGSVRAAVVHASPDAPEVAVFVTAPGAAIGASAPLGTFEFGDTLGPVEVPAGDYQIRVAVPPGSGPYDDGDVVFDSGTLSLAAGADLQIAAVTSTVERPAPTSPISLVVLDGEGSSDLFDIGVGSRVRVVHASPDAPAVDVIVNDDFMAPVVVGAAYTDVTGFLGPLPAATYNFKVAPTTTMNAVLNFDAALEVGQDYTVLAYDLLGAPIKEWVLVDDNRRVATEARLRLVHAAPAAQDVDIYLLNAGELPGDPGISPAFSAVPFGAETGFVSAAVGTYDVYVTPAGDPGALAISAPGIGLQASGVYTAIAGDAAGGGAPLQLILADDFIAP